MMNPKVAFKPLSLLKSELEGIKKRKRVKHIMFTDELINITKERVRQIEKKALKKLRVILKRKGIRLGDIYD